MPITYKILPLSDLFNGMPNKSPDWIAATKQEFFKGIDTYCNRKCKIPTPDKPLPSRIPNLYSSSSSMYGGNGGADFYYNQHAAGWQVSRVIIKCAAVIDAIQLVLTSQDGQNNVSPYFGGTEGW